MARTIGIRKASWLLVALAAAAGMLLLSGGATPGAAQVGPPPFTMKSIDLTGAEEVPPVETRAAGEFLWRWTDAGLEAELVISGAEFTMAHIHLGPKGANGPVVAWLFDDKEGQKAVHNVTMVTADKLVGPLAGKTLKDLEKELNAGNLYVNAHSKANPAGEIRGQIPAQPAQPAPSATGVATPRPPATGTGVEGGGPSLAFGLGLALLALAAAGGGLLVANRRS